RAGPAPRPVLPGCTGRHFHDRAPDRRLGPEYVEGQPPIDDDGFPPFHHRGVVFPGEPPAVHHRKLECAAEVVVGPIDTDGLRFAPLEVEVVTPGVPTIRPGEGARNNLDLGTSRQFGHDLAEHLPVRVLGVALRPWRTYAPDLQRPDV